MVVKAHDQNIEKRHPYAVLKWNHSEERDRKTQRNFKDNRKRDERSG